MIKYRASPEANAEHPDDIYTPAMHAATSHAAALILQNFSSPEDTVCTTPWLRADGPHGESLVRVEAKSERLQVTTVSTRTGEEYGQFYGGLLPHFIKDIVKLEDETMAIKTKIYLPVHQTIGIILFNQPVSGGMMMGYPSLATQPPVQTCSEIQETEPIEPATRSNMSGLFTERPFALKHWLRVDLPE